MRQLTWIVALVWFVELVSSMQAADWSQFRGPNCSGTASGRAALPAEIGPTTNVIWRTELPPGHSSPIVVGDRIYVTGELGGGSAALDEFYAGRKARPRDFARHFHPLPRIAIGRFLRAKGLASAMIDLSDGLSTDLAHLCEESGVGAEILREAIPLATVDRQGTQVKLRHALHGGDDYELLFTVPTGKPVPARIAGVPVTLIGHMQHRAGIVLSSAAGVSVPLKPQGWEHFKA